jgi:hypothetical protein
MVLIISYALYKIRNQAKTNYLGQFNRTNGKKLKNKANTENALNEKANQQEYLNDSKKQKLKKFVVVNEELKANMLKNLHFSTKQSIYKFYEEFNSEDMFKIKPGIGTK